MQLDVSSDVFKSYAFFASVLALKMFAMSFLTAIQRFKKGVFANPEDIKGRKAAVKYDDEDVERVRRAHLNDMENIFPFFVIAFLYCFIHPDADSANLLFKVFTISRIVHTFVYAVYVIPQPARALSWGVSFFINIFMAAKIAFYFM